MAGSSRVILQGAVVWTGTVCSKQAEGHVTKLLHMLLTQLATVGPIATALALELPGAALRDLWLSREGACHCRRPKHVLGALCGLVVPRIPI